MSGVRSPRRRKSSLRLPGFDYATDGAYYVTLCVQRRMCLLGDVVEREIALNDAGRMAESWWFATSEKFPRLELDEFVVMPNHMHGVLWLRELGAESASRTNLAEVVQWFKTMTTNAYIRGVREHGWAPFPGRFWHRSYFDHIVRDESQLNKIREYIRDNPRRWSEDSENPGLDMAKTMSDRRDGAHTGAPLPLPGGHTPA